MGTRVALTLEKYNTYQKDSGGGKSTERFLANDKFEKIGVVQAVLFGNNGKHKAVVKCKHKDSTHYYDQEYDTDDLQVVGSDGVPVGTVFVLGGIAESGVKVKLREETKEASAGKCLSRPTYGFTGTVEDIDPNADDNLKVQVRCVGSKDGEEASDWYEPEHLEVADMPTDQGVPIFGGFASVGSVVEVMVSARGVKCLGKPSVGDIGVVMGIDPNASEGETLNIKCGRDIRINTKVTNWYKPTDVKIYSKPDMSGTDEERKEVEIIKKRSELFTVQRSKPKSEAEILKRTDDIARITKEIETLEKDVEDMRKKGTSLEGMRQLYNRLMEELVKFRRTTSVIDNDYNTAKLDTTCNISDVSTEDILRKEGDAIIQRYYLIEDNDTFDDVYSVVPVAGAARVDINFVSDAAPPDPAQLKRLEDNAKQALDDYNADTADPLRKVIADTAVTALSDFKKQRKYQGPQTDSQRNYIKKRDELIKLFKTAAVTPAGAPRTINLARTYDFTIAGAPVNYFQVAADKYSAYLDVVKEVELLRNKNDIDNPIAEANRIIAAKGRGQPFTDELAFLTAMATIIDVASSQPLVTAAAGSPNETVKTAGLMLEAAAASADPVAAAVSLKETTRQRLEGILNNISAAVTALPASTERTDADNNLVAAIAAIASRALGAPAVAATPAAPARQSGADLAIIAIEAAIKSLKTLNEARFSRDIESINKTGRELLAAYSSNRVALQAPELDLAQAKCNLAAYDLYVALVESASGIVDLFLTKLYWEREYRNSQAKEDYEGDFRRNFDETDVILQKLNESRKSFSTALESAANAAIPTVSLFKKLTTAFDEFDLSRRSIFDEVHGEVTDLEKRIKIMIGLKKQQMIKVFELRKEMTLAQSQYAEAVKKEKTADFLLMNAFLKRRQENDRYLTTKISTPSSPQQPQEPNTTGRRGRNRNRATGGELVQYGGEISSSEREIGIFLARAFTNFARIKHYKSIILKGSEYGIVSEFINDGDNSKINGLYRKLASIIPGIFTASVDNNNLFQLIPAAGAPAALRPIVGRLASPAAIKTQEDAARATRQANNQVQRRVTATAAADLVLAAIDQRAVADVTLENIIDKARNAVIAAQTAATQTVNAGVVEVTTEEAKKIAYDAASAILSEVVRAKGRAGSTPQSIYNAADAKKAPYILTVGGGGVRRTTRRLMRY